MTKSRQFLVCFILVAAVATLSVVILTAVPTPGHPYSGLVKAVATASPSVVPTEQEKKGEREGEIILAEETNVKTRLVKRVNPVYPKEAKEKGITGKVVCRVHVDTDGKVTEVTVTTSPDDLLSKAATDAVEQWEWEPVEKEGKKVPFVVDVTINFTLKE